MIIFSLQFRRAGSAPRHQAGKLRGECPVGFEGYLATKNGLVLVVPKPAGRGRWRRFQLHRRVIDVVHDHFQSHRNLVVG